jgi:hypothetical protein
VTAVRVVWEEAGMAAWAHPDGWVQATPAEMTADQAQDVLEALSGSTPGATLSLVEDEQ